MLQPDLYKGLEKVASLYLDLRPWKHLASTEEARYNAIDVSVTMLLAEKMLALLSETGMYDHFSRVVMPALRTLMNMTRRGLKVDRIFPWLLAR
jgi:DNA polymerase I-like protein with 3'-5' exonuclease and polymerase domains